MCDPVSAVVVGSAAVGSAMQIAGQSQARGAMARTLTEATNRQAGFTDRDIALQREDLGRQRVFRGQAMDAAAEGQRAFEQPVIRAAMDAGTADRGAAYRAAVAMPTDYLPGQGAGPQIVRDYVDGRRATEGARVGAMADSLAAQGGWQDALFGAGVAQQRAGDNIRFINNAAGGSAALTTQARGANRAVAQSYADLLPLQYQVAGQRGAPLRTAGDLVMGASMLAAPHLRSGWGSVFARQGGPKA